MVAAEVLRIVGLMRWAVLVQKMIMGLQAVNVVTAIAIAMWGAPLWVTLLAAVASCALYGASRLALNYQHRLRWALDELLSQLAYDRGSV